MVKGITSWNDVLPGLISSSVKRKVLTSFNDVSAFPQLTREIFRLLQEQEQWHQQIVNDAKNLDSVVTVYSNCYKSILHFKNHIMQVGARVYMDHFYFEQDKIVHLLKTNQLKAPKDLYLLQEQLPGTCSEDSFLPSLCSLKAKIEMDASRLKRWDHNGHNIMKWC